MSADALLAIIAGRDTTGYYEVRGVHPKGGVRERGWFALSDRAECLRFIARHAPRLDVYVGAAPRVKRDAGGGKANIFHAWACWVDCDEEKSPGVVERLMAFRPAPTLVIRSGSGIHCHAWWALTAPITEWYSERANERLRYHLGPTLDRCSNFDRVMRAPGTLNHKADFPVEVTTLCGTGRPVSPYGLLRDLPNSPLTLTSSQLRPVRPDAYRATDRLLGVSADRYYEVLTGREVTYGNVQCPFHSGGKERNPSMKLYETTWACFSCPPNGNGKTAGGDVYEFGARLWSTGKRGDDFKRLKERLTKALGVE